LHPVTALKNFVSPVCNTVLWSCFITKCHIQAQTLNSYCFPGLLYIPQMECSAKEPVIISHQPYMCHTNELC